MCMYAQVCTHMHMRGPMFGYTSVKLLFQVDLPFPDEGLVYDYQLDDAGISMPALEEEEEEELKGKTVSNTIVVLVYKHHLCRLCY